MSEANLAQFSITQFIDDSRKLLPIQFPLGIFIHNNMLINLEDLKFEDALNEATKIYGAKQTLSEKYYLRKFSEKRIAQNHLETGIENWLKKNLKGNREVSRDLIAFYYKLMINPLSLHLDDSFSNVVHSKSSDASWDLWQKSEAFAKDIYGKFKRIPVNPRKIKKRKMWKDYLNLSFGERVNDHFHPVLIRFLSCYLDQGMAVIPNPNKDSGLLKDFLEYLYDNGDLLPEGLALSKDEFLALYSQSPEQFALKQIEKIISLEIPLVDCQGSNQSVEEYLRLTLLELRGWAGMINKFEKESWLVPREKGKMSVLEYLGIYLLLELKTYKYLKEKYKLKKDWLSQKFINNESYVNLELGQLTYIVDQVASRLPTYFESDHQSQVELLENILKFDKTERCIIWQNAFDLTCRDAYLSSIQYARVKNEITTSNEKVKAQFIFCIDDREESIRRHLEELNSNIRTYGVVGFFGIDMKYKSIHHPHPLNHCPPVITPSRIIYEKIIDTDQNKAKAFSKINKIMAEMAFMLFYKNRASWYSIVLTIILAPLFSSGLLLRIFKPLWANKLNDYLKQKWVGKFDTQLVLNRCQDDNGNEVGYDFEERALIVSKILKMAGLVDKFAQFVFIVAHSAKSVNNPYRNAYGCGACSGRAGLPNSKIFCQMVNELMVQKILREKYNINIPEGTFFVSTCHDTTTDQIMFLNEADMPKNLQGEYLPLKQDFLKAAELNAFERTRLFENKIAINSSKEAHEHVMMRASSMAEPRPEYGHTNNLGCFVGRRETVKKLFLDRRSFLTSYDASIDPGGEILEMLLGGVIPVVGGINMDYYLSRLDNEKFGSGTKLPLNVTALVGVMTGGCSDLRIGLSKQMVEKHEPVRITVILEADLETAKRLIVKNPRIKKLIYNHWIHFAVFDPKFTDHYYLLEDQEFVKKIANKEFVDNFPRIGGKSINQVLNKLGPIPFYYKTSTDYQESAS